MIQTTPRARKHSIAPSLSMPAALDSQAEPNNWFPPSPKAPSLSSSASSNYTPIRQVLQPPSPFQSHPFSGRPGLVSRASDQQAFALRTAVMMGTMTPQVRSPLELFLAARKLTRWQNHSKQQRKRAVSDSGATGATTTIVLWENASPRAFQRFLLNSSSPFSTPNISPSQRRGRPRSEGEGAAAATTTCLWDFAILERTTTTSR